MKMNKEMNKEMMMNQPRCGICGNKTNQRKIKTDIGRIVVCSKCRDGER